MEKQTKKLIAASTWIQIEIIVMMSFIVCSSIILFEYLNYLSRKNSENLTFVMLLLFCVEIVVNYYKKKAEEREKKNDKDKIN